MVFQSCKRALILTGVIVFMAAASPSAAQTIGFERERGREMLAAIKDDIKKNYYDPKFHGVDVDARFKGAEQRTIQVKAKVKQGVRVHGQTESDIVDLIREAENADHLHEHRFAVDEGGTLLIWKMPQFDLSESQIDSIMDRARKHKALIIDLRGNGGGLESTQLRLVGNLFDHDIKIGDIHRRKETKPLIAKTRGANNIFKGQLAVLIDSDSGSSSEIFARLIQLEKR